MATAATQQPLADPRAMADFLAHSVCAAIQLVAIGARGITARWFGDQSEQAAEWATHNNMLGANLYWTVNVCRERLLKKPAKSDMESARFVHVDIDPPKDGRPWDITDATGRIQACVHSPSFIIASGGGLQAFWRLDAPICLERVEEINKGAAAAFGGDHCWNVDRLMRLPGSVNWPDPAKQARGRIPALAHLVLPDEGLTHTALELDTHFCPPTSVGAKRASAGSDITLLSADDLGLAQYQPLRVLIDRPVGQDRSRDALACVGHMVRDQYSDAEIIGVLLNPANAVSAHILAQRDPMYAACRSIEKARSSGSRKGAKPAHLLTSAADPRSQNAIKIVPGEIHTIVTEAQAALIDAGTPFYVRAGSLVQPISQEVPASDNRRTTSATLKQVDVHTLIDHMSRSATWEKWNERSNDWRQADPPERAASVLLSRQGEWKFPPVLAVISTPTLRGDGTILFEPDYDEHTGLVLLNLPSLPPIPAMPTREDAEAAVKLLDGLLDDFPFVDAASRSVALSALITPVVRGAMDTALMHVLDAHERGTGKTYLVDLASMIATGDCAPVLAAGQTEEETEKRLGAALLEGLPFVSIDNLNGDLYGDQLCQMIERPVVSVRPLGSSKLMRITSRATVFATGNNIRIVGDMTRRAIVCSLDANVERPEFRAFNGDPLAKARNDREKYIAAALVVSRAYAVAGFPEELRPLASFSQWSRYVRSPLVWLGYADPVATMEKSTAGDPIILTLRPLLHAMHLAFGSAARKAGQIVREAESFDLDRSHGHAQLHEVLTQVCSPEKGGGLDARRLGKYLSRHKGRVVNGLKLVSNEDAHSGQLLWKVIKL